MTNRDTKAKCEKNKKSKHTHTHTLDTNTLSHAPCKYDKKINKAIKSKSTFFYESYFVFLRVD